jgi:hypothetical protein
LLEFRGAFQPVRLKKRETMRCREPLDRTRRRLQASTRRPVGLRQHQGDFVACGQQARQSPLSELGRAGEN